MRDDPYVRIHLSIHHDSPEYLELIQPNLELLGRWQAEYGIGVSVIKSYGEWTRRYLGSGSQIEPFEDNDPRRSWEICRAKKCPQLFEGSIWKCAALAYLKMQDEKYDISSKWAPYLRCRPLAADCTEEELHAFFDREDEPYCGMCSATPRVFTTPPPAIKASRSAITSGSMYSDPGP